MMQPSLYATAKRPSVIRTAADGAQTRPRIFIGASGKRVRGPSALTDASRSPPGPGRSIRGPACQRDGDLDKIKNRFLKRASGVGIIRLPGGDRRGGRGGQALDAGGTCPYIAAQVGAFIPIGWATNSSETPQKRGGGRGVVFIRTFFPDTKHHQPVGKLMRSLDIAIMVKR